MIHIKEAIIVEGRYDVNKIKQLVDTVVIETSGFGIFNNKEKLALIRRIAEERGILVLTDSDGAGFVIRNYLRGAIPKEQVRHAYIPQIVGKERRKTKGSKEGTLGVEGVPDEIIIQALKNAGVECIPEDNNKPKITKADFYEWGLAGVSGSNEKRKKLLRALNLPQHMTANALLEFINAIADYDEIKKTISEL
ncbi:MAG: DUF4093 domain-containing protein [Eubacteriales bacterium]|nr:DUF4093 domain-containing protein [Eubacteriales bacterium]